MRVPVHIAKIIIHVVVDAIFLIDMFKTLSHAVNAWYFKHQLCFGINVTTYNIMRESRGGSPPPPGICKA